MIEIDLSISLGTIIAIIGTFVAIGTLCVIVYFEHKRERDNKIALLNSLFDEIHHNLNLSRGLFFLDESDDFLRSICHELERLYGIDAPARNRVYPNPSDDPNLPPTHPDREVFFRSVQLNITGNIAPANVSLINHLTSTIEKAFASGSVWNLAGRRPAQNLGHLFFSLKRLDVEKNNYSNNRVPRVQTAAVHYFTALGLNNQIPFHNLIFQYWLWLHFRLWFLYLDLALSSGKSLILRRDIIDHDSLRNIKCRIGENEWRRLSRILRKTRNK